MASSKQLLQTSQNLYLCFWGNGIIVAETGKEVKGGGNTDKIHSGRISAL